MSRVHDALTRASQSEVQRPPEPAWRAFPPLRNRLASGRASETPPDTPAETPGSAGQASETPGSVSVPSPAAPLAGLLERIQEVPWAPDADSHVIDVGKPAESPTEEFRSLRTRLNHMKEQQPLSTLVVTSPSPAEGKSFTASNLAVVQSHLHGNSTLLCDFDFRRPLLHRVFGIERSPGLTDYLQGRAALHEAILRVAGTNLFLAPAGSPVLNPLELLNLPEARQLFARLPTLFHWVILDSPPLLFAADANLLSTMADGTLLVVRLGHTSVDSVTRAIQSMSRNNVIGVVANGAKRGELYSKYAYYHSYYSEQRPSHGENPFAEAD